MKRIIILLVGLVFCISLFASDQTDLVWENGIQNFKDNEFQEALENFLSIENEGINDPDLFYNIGNCYFRLNEIGRSVLYYKKALKLDNGSEQARRNLKYALSFTLDKQKTSDENLLRSFWKKSFDALSINFLAILSLLLFILIIILICIIIIKFHGREKTIPIFIMTIFILFFVIFIFLTFLKYSNLSKQNEAVLISQSAIGYSGPSDDFTRVFTIHEGMIFSVEKTQDNWSLIKLNNGLGGWVGSATFERIK